MFSFHHVSISVTDIDRSIQFYETLGFKVVLRWKADDQSLQITHLRLNEVILRTVLFCKASAGT
uniref:Glyoxalase/Bleomycin resistance protein/Dioxygenase superfamily protein n=1 Tax=Candidatus Kentrum sp. TUN TaxID=2126343 RepID=A0A450ZME7_9GAMM|nr:MAG: Glyoxalase/Bleomycin resistance protein/Dioxygenase superfamily protein [Candidatus Kentron sp. TUN]VFK58585.1 MAG: Glyoxalase/Bleomycin resistance protein/Dioxygenase superfamily protein [Candidatus Kentron sp. TUN]VFK61152.1 MAG: Glyoxalase/Bleomycin resistance protein/Dioxygenase superfamily protein [Candidatus Kentron sp. TUN]